VTLVESSEVVVNDPGLTARLGSALRRELGESNVVPLEPSTASEDIGVFGRIAGVPSVQLRVGAPAADVFAKARAEGRYPPGAHTSKFAPDRQPTIRTGVSVLTLSVLELLRRPTS
jgi:hippurate hydrolase